MPKTNEMMKSYRILSIQACDIFRQTLKNGDYEKHEHTGDAVDLYKQTLDHCDYKNRKLCEYACDAYKQLLDCGDSAGYKLSDKDKDESGYFWRFQNKLDYSLDLIELKRIYKDICGVPFEFCDKLGNEHTLAVINIKFNCVYKIKEGDKERTITNTNKLRHMLYECGFYVGGVHYVRYKRSAGSSRDGNCLFIDERLYDAMAKWGECGLSEQGDLASWEAYKALSLSSVKGIVNIPVEGILFVPDYKSTFEDEVISVELQDKRLVAQTKRTQITNEIWDGESLLDESLFVGDYAAKHMLLLRNKFFKSCAFRTKLKKWINDKGITLDGLKARGFVTLASDVDQIVMVTTPNSLKYLKFVGGKLSEENIHRWADCVNSVFGVVKWDKRTRYFDGRMVSGSYQLFNTIGLNKDQAKQFMQPSLEYMKSIRNDIEFMRYHFSDVISKEDDCVEDDEWNDSDGIAQRAEVILKLMNINNDFQKTRLYVNLRDDWVKAQRKNLREGRILVRGTNATLFGNGPELLKYIAGDENPQSELARGQIRCGKFKHGQRLLCARSPHITMGNLYCAENNLDGAIWDYFDLGDNIVCVNAIGENIQQKLNGCDYDSDTMLITDHPTLVETAKKNEGLFKVPVCSIKSSGAAKHTLAELDHSTSVNKIGEIVNLSQKLNSKIWDSLNNGNDDIQDIYSDVCKLAVLSGLEIDKAKRAYDDVRVGTELYVIKKNHKDNKSPKFFKQIHAKQKKPKKENDGQTDNTPPDPQRDKHNEPKIAYAPYDTAMEYMYKAVGTLRFCKGKDKYATYIPISQMLNVEPTLNPSDNAVCEEVIRRCDEYKDKLNNLYKRIERHNADKSECDVIYDRICEMKDERDREIGKLITNANILYRVIEHYENNETIDWHIYAPLLNNKIFRSILKESKTKLNRVVENEFGKFNLYEFRYNKV